MDRTLRLGILVVLAITFALGSLSGCQKSPAVSMTAGIDTTRTADPTPTLIYVSPPTVTPTPGIPFTDEQSATMNEVVNSEAPSTNAPPTPDEAPNLTDTPQDLAYTVQPGDTLLALATRHNLPMAAVQKANGMGSSTTLYAGQTLVIPAADPWQGASAFWTVYEVQPGDTVTGIAQKFGLDFVALIAVNDLTNADVLQIGQPLVLPVDVLTDVAAHTVVASAPPKPTLGATAPLEALVAAGTPTPKPVAVEPPMPTVPAGISAPTEITSWPGDVFALINAERAAVGLGPFVWNDTLAQAAYLHGLDCQQRGFCNHTGSDGSTVKTRVLRAGYPALGAAECIVYSKNPQQAVFWWMDEVPPDDWHRRTILSTWVTEIGIAVVPNHLGTYYFIADFGRPQ